VILFRNFTPPLWKMFAGNFLLLLCSLFYLAWWAVSFRPNQPGGSSGGLWLAAAFITGIAGLGLMSAGIGSLSRDSGSRLVMNIVLGAAAVFFVLLAVTSIAFHRPLTSELLIIHVWAAIELCAIAALYTADRFGPGRATTIAALVAIATVVGMACYVLYYRLDEAAAYRAGMAPLAVDAVVMAVFLAVMAFS